MLSSNNKQLQERPVTMIKAPSRHRLWSPMFIFAKLLLTILILETGVMLLLPLLLPESLGLIRVIADAVLLTILSAPIIWVLIARPLRAAAESEMTRSKATLEYLVEAVINFDDSGCIESLNPAAERMFGYRPAEIIGRNITEIIPDAELKDRDSLVTLTENDPLRNWSARRTTSGSGKEKECFPIELSLSPLYLLGRWTYIAIIHDITERKRMEACMSEQKEFVDNLVQNSVIPTFVLSPGHQVLLWNKACEELTGVKAETMLENEKPWEAVFGFKRPFLAEMVIDSSIDPLAHYTTFGKSALIPEGLVAEQWYRNLNGSDRYLLLNAAPIRNSSGRLLAVVETLQDMTERKRYEEQLEYQATHDQLTGLPNRNLLGDRIQQSLLTSSRNHHQVAIMFIDLDFFKFINDSLGHTSGDEVLKVIATRLTDCLRAGDTVARLGGDEFVVVISEPSVTEYAGAIAGKIQKTISEPIRIDEHEFVVMCSLGISIFPRDGSDVQSLMKNADVAMYRAKDLGRNNFQFYASEMNVASLAHMTMERHLRKAIERNEFFLHYQPKVSLATGLMTGMEALLRWRSPELGMVSPANFIPLAEETGLIEQIGEWVIRTACTQNKAWQDAGLPALRVATNLSVRQFRQSDIGAIIKRTLEETGLDARYLEIEITESLIMQNSEQVLSLLKEVKGLGIHLTMDDFGTGYSSLSYLNRLPFDSLKIDISFVRDITSNPNSAAIAKAIIAMAHSLHLKVIAEGVETEGQLHYLQTLHCDEIQGYYFSRPLPAEEFGQLLIEWRCLELWKDQHPDKQKTILVVDDEEHVISMVRRLLYLDGYEVLSARSAREGFEFLANNRVAVVLCDQWMPEMNGSEFLGKVKELYPDSVRILMSGNADLGSVTNAVNEGEIFKFITKPWQDELFRKSIHKAFKQSESLVGRG